MSKRAEQKAKEYEKSLDYYHYTSDNPSVAYQKGYEQAEKDLALNAESIGCIIEIWLNTLREEKWRGAEREDVCKEVLRKFNQFTK